MNTTQNKPESTTITPTVALANLMMEATKTCRTPAISFGFMIANGCLERIAHRAVALGDAELLKELELIGYISMKAGPDKQNTFAIGQKVCYIDNQACGGIVKDVQNGPDGEVIRIDGETKYKPAAVFRSCS
jgi:hypothetical protein